MAEPRENSLALLRKLDSLVSQALGQAGSSPFLGLLEFSDEDRTNAQEAISNVGYGYEKEVKRILRKFQNFAAWYLCDAVRRSYGKEENVSVWPYIAEALSIESELSHSFRHALHDIVARKCKELGLPVPHKNRVSLFRLHAGGSEAQLPALIRAFLAQERHYDLPSLDDGYALNEWKVAINIIAAIRQGHDTFGKIRKALDYDDLSLKAGLRHAHNWLPIIERSGSVQRPQLTRKQARVESNGRRYSVVIV